MGKPPLGLDAMHEIAKKKGGLCLSGTYRNARTPLLWQCARGHRWRAMPHKVKGTRYNKGSWCRECFLERQRERPSWPEPLTLTEMQAIAASRGGRCVSGVYDRLSLRWECARHHQWDAKPTNVKQGTWCPVCAGTQKGDLESLQRIAARRRGRCVSDEYVNAFTPLEWECELGHRWSAPPYSVKGTSNKRGSWCPICADTTLGLEQMHELARERGGRCLSRRYDSNRVPLRWECARRHKWSAAASEIARGSWCRKCSFEDRSLQLEDMRALAMERGGRCLSKKYINNKTKLLWQCARGHQWRQKADIVKNRGSWCGTCAREDKLETLKELARERGGRCLSARYGTVKTKLRWRCARGHEWRAIPSSIKAGSWCPVCRRR